jgi:hypothetical protein
MSLDGVFENGKAWNVDTGEEIPLDGLKALSEKSAALIIVGTIPKGRYNQSKVW